MKSFKSLSKFRKLYYFRFFFRFFVLIMSVLLFFLSPLQFDILSPLGFFEGFSVFHIMWLFWMADMLSQMLPCRRYWPVGSQKFLEYAFHPAAGQRHDGFARFLRQSRREALTVGAAWLVLTLCIGAAYFLHLIDQAILLLITVAFYVCDVICVLFWCPFRVFLMKNRCCSTCRIFNWDHMMMFSPLVFVPGFFSWSLCAVSIIVLLVWEISFHVHPERFWEGSNTALLCSGCTDLLCGGRLRQISGRYHTAKEAPQSSRRVSRE